MAGYNPFRGFRKKQKLWLAILGVGTMISFIILPALLQLFSGTGGPRPGEVVRCRKFGNMNEETLRMLNANRMDLSRLYELLWRNLISPDGSNQMELYGLRAMADEYSRMLGEETLVNNWFLSQYALEHGMSVTQSMIIDHLTQLSGGLLSDDIFQTTLRQLGMSERRLEYLLRDEILRNQMMVSFQISQSAVSPATRWDWFQRLNRKMTAEVVGVPVDRFLSKVSEPNESELRRFFEEHKNTLYNPSMPESGLTVPNQVAFEYVVAAPGQKILDSITKEEIGKYYEDNKEPMFRKPTQPLPERPNLPGQATLPGMDGSIFRNNPGMTAPSPRADNVAPVTVEGEKQAPSNEKADAEPAAEKAEKTEPAPPAAEKEAEKEEKQPESKPDAAPKPESNADKKTEENQSSIRRRAVTTRPVSHQVEKEASSDGATEKSATEKAPVEKVAENPQEKAEPKEPEKKPETVAEKEARPAEPKPEEPKKDEDDKKEVVDLSILYKPLDEVESQIRQILAQEKVEQALPQIESKMRDYFHTYNLHFEQQTTAPPVPDLAEFAESLGLKLISVQIGTFYDAMKSDFARGMKERDQMIRLFREVPILFQPSYFEGDEGRVLIWVTEARQQYTPQDLDSVRETVVSRWKEIQARPLARQQAEELAAEARASEKSLSEAFASRSEVRAVETEPFTWKSYGEAMYAAFMAMRGIPPQVGEVREKGVASGNSALDNKLIFAPGEEFMEVVSGLRVGEVGVVFNQPQTVAYVVRLTGSSPSEEALWEQFQNAPFQEYRLAGQPEAVRSAWEDWIKKMQDEVGLQWVRKPKPLEEQDRF